MIDLSDLEFTATAEGRKSSEGDGLTAADIRAEQAREEEDTEDGAR
jgi:hypothetical protein